MLNLWVMVTTVVSYGSVNVVLWLAGTSLTNYESVVLISLMWILFTVDEVLEKFKKKDRNNDDR